MTKTKGICYFCGERGLMTKDHIPPRNIYPKEIGNEYKLIKVRMCSLHHRTYSNYAQYFIILLNCLTEKTIHHSTVKEYKPKAKRALEKPKLISFWNRIALSIDQPRWRKNTAGVYVYRSRLEIDYDAISRLFDSMVRGLFHREKRYIEVLNKSFSTVLLIPDDHPEKVREEMYKHLGFLKIKKPTVHHGDVFRYSNVYFDDLIKLPHSIWCMNFYNAHDFFVVVYSDKYKGTKEDEEQNY